MNPFYFNYYAIPFGVTSLFFFATGGYVLGQSPKSTLNVCFFGICLSVAVWLASTSFLLSSQDPAAIRLSINGLYLGVSFISVTVFSYSSFWLDFSKRQKLLIYLGFLLSVIFTLIIWTTPWIVSGYMKHSWGHYSRLTLWGGGAYLVFFATYMLLFFMNLFRTYRKTSEPLLKHQIRLVLFGFLVAYVGSVDFLPCYGIEIFPIGALTTFVLVCALGYTIIRYKLLDIETVIHKTVMWFLSTIVAILPFALVGYLTQSRLRQLSQAQATAGLLVLLVSFYFYFRAIQPKLDLLFRRRHANLQAVLNRFSAELVHLKDLKDLLTRFASTLRESIFAKQIAVFLMEETSSKHVPLLIKGFQNIKPLPCANPFLDLLTGHDETVILDLAISDPRFKNHAHTIQLFRAEMQAQVFVPFVLNTRLIGFLLLGKKENLKKYTAEEIHFLSCIKVPVTIAVSNSQQFENVSKLYAQVQNQNERLKELDRLKSEFLANTSHELRTPIQGILGLVESMLDGADGIMSEAQRTHLKMIVESGGNLKELINNLLELSRIESGQAPVKIKPFNILNVVDAVIVLLDPLARKKNLYLKHISPGALSDVFGDPEKIQRVLINLIGNAIKFTEKGGVAIRLAEENSAVTVAVEDTGIGISAADQEIIFERFRQAEGSATRRFEGTGLGLSIAREIVRLHASEITVRSMPGKGSIFSFALSKNPFSIAPDHARSFAMSTASEDPRPRIGNLLTQASPGKDREYSLEKDPEFEEAVRGKGEKILIVDDNTVNREVVRTRLELNHYQAIEAVDGIDGLEKLEQEKPELIILDLMMPRMSGYEFCKRVRSESTPDEAPIIMLTARTDMGDKIYGLQLGANDYISKPFNKEELIARVAVLLRIRQMSRELRKWNEELESRVDERTKELLKTQEQLIQAEKLATLGTLAGGVAHEINNPLTAVLTNVQMLRPSASKDDLESISLIEEGARRCQSIVQKLMKYARKPSDAEMMRVVDLNQVIQNTLGFLSFQLEQENIKLIKNLKPLPTIKGVPNELEQVFTNLFLNAKDAIKAAKSSGTIEIRTAESNGAVCVEIKDDGIGIPQKNISRIFDPFFTTKDVGKGTGLGLSISYGIVEKHGGKIEVSSCEGQGSLFTITFPKD
ncbi:MAG: response regulator [Candidatus Omnitrophica bacterium]|nr:response regulator [Candidatus Omnitrophota bacterium]